MNDTVLFLKINGLAGKVPFIDEFFKGVSNDYFAIISSCLVLIWLWFATRNSSERLVMQKAVMTTAIAIGLAAALVVIVNVFYFRPRPFADIPAGMMSLLFYKPTDSSFPSNLAAVTFAFIVPVFRAHKKYGLFLLAIACLSAFGRVFIGVHYPLDVAAGAGIGIVAGFLAWGAGRLLDPLMNFLIAVMQKAGLA